MLGGTLAHQRRVVDEPIFGRIMLRLESPVNGEKQTCPYIFLLNIIKSTVAVSTLQLFCNFVINEAFYTQ